MKEACPLELVVPDTVVTIELPVAAVKVMVFPEMGLLLESSRVTVIVEVVTPSAGTEVGLATTVDLDAEAAPKNVTVAVWVIVTVPPVVSFAV